MFSFLSPMGWYWIVVPLAVAVFGILVLLRGAHHVVRGRHGRGAAHFVAGTPLAIVPNIRQTCKIQGDEWEMGARVQKWKNWANVLGLDATYTLDQVNNRYSSAARGNGRPITACDLRGPPPSVNRYVPRAWLFWLIDRSYTEQRRFGSATYMPLADGATYRVVMTQSGLNAEPTNDIARAANDARR